MQGPGDDRAPKLLSEVYVLVSSSDRVSGSKRNVSRFAAWNPGSMVLLSFAVS